MHLEAEIEMEMTGRVFLDDEPATASLPASARQLWPRFSRPREVALRFIFGERSWPGERTRNRLPRCVHPRTALRLYRGFGRGAGSRTRPACARRSELRRQLLFQFQDRREKIAALLQPFQRIPGFEGEGVDLRFLQLAPFNRH